MCWPQTLGISEILRPEPCPFAHGVVAGVAMLVGGVSGTQEPHRLGVRISMHKAIVPDGLVKRQLFVDAHSPYPRE